MSLFGGIVIVIYKFLIMKVVVFLEDVEKVVKGYKLEVNGEYVFSKNSIVLFGMFLYWDMEY